MKRRVLLLLPLLGFLVLGAVLYRGLSMDHRTVIRPWWPGISPNSN